MNILRIKQFNCVYTQYIVSSENEPMFKIDHHHPALQVQFNFSSEHSRNCREFNSRKFYFVLRYGLILNDAWSAILSYTAVEESCEI